MADGYLSEIFLSFQGEGTQVGRRQLFVRLAGCNLRCRYCDTPDSLERVPSCRVSAADGTLRELANPLSAAAVLDAALPLLEPEAAVDGMALTGGEPLLQTEFLAELLADDRWPRPRLLETNGMLPESLRAVLPLVDVVSMDIKLPSNSGERGFWDQHARFLAIAGDKAYVKVLVDAGTDLDDVDRAAALVGDRAAVFLQPITAGDGRVDVTANDLRRFFAAARRHVADVRVLPQTHKMLAIR
ncbi:MAG TPA: 7-carboxy-7-deazaguanine synthase QueE [Candidatus Dormibacteraeota bacterium]|nr:7-carboxy-7-deazaguanine synthase QueE [Candidatus Dormibacteraeota bacterium]